jgi:hypothetical protein
MITIIKPRQRSNSKSENQTIFLSGTAGGVAGNSGCLLADLAASLLLAPLLAVPEGYAV